MESGVAIIAASHDSQNRPVLGHVLGCRVAEDGGRVILLLSRSRYPFLLDAVRRSGMIAVSFNEASTHKSIQVKGESAEPAAPEPGDAARVSTYLDLFTADLARIHVDGGMARAALGAGPDDLAAIGFVPVIAFLQTPGAKAGSAISA